MIVQPPLLSMTSQVGQPSPDSSAAIVVYDITSRSTMMYTVDPFYDCGIFAKFGRCRVFSGSDVDVIL